MTSDSLTNSSSCKAIPLRFHLCTMFPSSMLYHTPSNKTSIHGPSSAVWVFRLVIASLELKSIFQEQLVFLFFKQHSTTTKNSNDELDVGLVRLDDETVFAATQDSQLLNINPGRWIEKTSKLSSLHAQSYYNLKRPCSRSATGTTVLYVSERLIARSHLVSIRFHNISLENGQQT